jgi:hypothetical protein
MKTLNKQDKGKQPAHRVGEKAQYFVAGGPVDVEIVRVGRFREVWIYDVKDQHDNQYHGVDLM